MRNTISGEKAALGMLAALMIAAPGVALATDEAISGMIIAHEGSTIVVKSGGADTRVTLTPDTKIRGTTGVLGVRGEARPASDLIRGLAVSVTVAAGDHGLAATEVIFKKSDLKTAQQIQAGLVGTENRVSENAQGVARNSDRIDNVGELVAVDRAKVFFASGSAALTTKGRQDLQDLAAKAKDIKGYRLAVVGRADTTGNAAANQKLSEARAAAVTAYLMKSCGVLPGRILPTAAIGDSAVAQDLDPPKSDEEARRVTVTIAVSKSAAD